MLHNLDNQNNTKSSAANKIKNSKNVFGWIVDFNNPVAQTQHGSIKGRIDERRTKFNRRPICSFLSIPYARPPIGANRFLPPVDPDPWQNLDAVSKRVMCPQVEQRFRLHISTNEPILESEDCLYLNVFIPVDRATPVINYPVIVYIHGGEFKHGSKDHYSPEYLLDHGVILVTINYRLGVLGFLSTDDLAAPGNLGLYDQIAALRWVKRNIQSFGGDADDVTLLGHNAGAISASLLLLAPHETLGLMHKVIAIGGSAMSPAALQWNPGRQAREFARQLRCMSDRSDDIVRCLRLKDWQTLVVAQRQSHNFESNSFRFWFRPVLDRNSSFSLLRAHPRELYSMGSFLKIPLMMGVSAHEGSLEYFLHWHQLRRLNSLQRMQFLIRPYLYEFARSEIIATTLNYQYVARYNSTGYAINGGSPFHHNGQQLNSLETPLLLGQRLTPGRQYWHEQTNMGFERNEYDVYIGANDIASKEVARQIDAIGDFLFVAPAIKQLELHSQSVGQSYMFVFDYKGTRSFGHLQLNPYGRAYLGSASDRELGEPHSNGWLPSTPTRMGAIISTETSQFGVTHCDDLFYLLPNDFAPIALTSAEATNLNDENAIRSYVTYLVAFASHINEQQAAGNNLANWLPFRHTDRNYIRFSDQLPTLYKNFRQSDVAFVNELVEPIEELVNTPLPLFPYEELRDLKISTIGLGLLLAIIVLTLALLLCFLLCSKKKRRLRRLDDAIIASSHQQRASASSIPLHGGASGQYKTEQGDQTEKPTIDNSSANNNNNNNLATSAKHSTTSSFVRQKKTITIVDENGNETAMELATSEDAQTFAIDATDDYSAAGAKAIDHQRLHRHREFQHPVDQHAYHHHEQQDQDNYRAASIEQHQHHNRNELADHQYYSQRAPQTVDQASMKTTAAAMSNVRTLVRKQRRVDDGGGGGEDDDAIGTLAASSELDHHHQMHLEESMSNGGRLSRQSLRRKQQHEQQQHRYRATSVQI